MESPNGTEGRGSDCTPHARRPQLKALAFPLLGIYALEIVLQVCGTMVKKKMFTVRLFEIVKNPKKPKGLPIGKYCHSMQSLLENVGVYILENVVSAGKHPIKGKSQ